MSLSPLVSFKSRFVTYLLNFPSTNVSKKTRRKSQNNARKQTKLEDSKAL